MATEYSINLLNNIAQHTRTFHFWLTPYRTGNLAASIGDLGQMGDGVGFIPFNANQRASYGEILNDAQIIRYSLTNTKTGKSYIGVYTNKHYQWEDKAAEQIAEQIELSFPVRRINSVFANLENMLYSVISGAIE